MNNTQYAVINDTLVYEFTADPVMLNQYASLLIAQYKVELRLDLVGDNMASSLTALTERERILVVIDKDVVIAGAKLTMSSSSEMHGLPMESGGFSVKTFLPEHYGDRPYAEIGRLVVNPSYRGKDVLAHIVELLSRYTYEMGGGYLFVMAPPINAVLYKRVCRTLAMDVCIHKDLKVPSNKVYQHLNLQLVSCDIRNLYAIDKRIAS